MHKLPISKYLLSIMVLSSLTLNSMKRIREEEENLYDQEERALKMVCSMPEKESVAALTLSNIHLEPKIDGAIVPTHSYNNLTLTTFPEDIIRCKIFPNLTKRKDYAALQGTCHLLRKIGFSCNLSLYIRVFNINGESHPDFIQKMLIQPHLKHYEQPSIVYLGNRSKLVQAIQENNKDKLMSLAHLIDPYDDTSNTDYQNALNGTPEKTTPKILPAQKKSMKSYRKESLRNIDTNRAPHFNGAARKKINFSAIEEDKEN